MFKEQGTMSERLEYIAKVVLKSYDNEESIAITEYLREQANRVTKLNPTQEEKITISEQLQEAIYNVMKDGSRKIADDVLDELVQMKYEDGHKSGVTIARVRSGLSTLVRLGFLTRIESEELEDESDKFHRKVSYIINKNA